VIVQYLTDPDNQVLRLLLNVSIPYTKENTKASTKSKIQAFFLDSIY